MKSPDAVLILRHLKVQNVNTISSPLTWGFPAMTAILGFVHALERKIHDHYKDLQLGGVGIICHQFNPQVFRSYQGSDGVFCLTRNPLLKDGSTPAFVEEGRAHMEISLIIQAYGNDCIVHEDKMKERALEILELAYTLRLAGGSILPEPQANHQQVQFYSWPDTEAERKKFTQQKLRRLLPGFVLLGRDSLLAERILEMQSTNPQATALDALLEFASLNFEPLSDDSNADTPSWEIRAKPGWIVPIPVGYTALTKLHQPGAVLNARDDRYPFRFVESLYSLGEWRSPHRIKHLNDIFWHYQANPDTGLYRCINQFNL
jgi:CRISPR-associated protein Csy2